MHPVQLLTIDQAFAAALGRDTDPRETGGGLSLLRDDSALARGLRDQILTLPQSDIPWGGFLAIDPVHCTVVGTCGFKGAPTPDHAIEIAYHTLPTFEGRGYATGMARALVEIAWSNPAIRAVCAHTLPHPSASTRVLTRLGMRQVGEVIDAVEGRVWRWMLERPSALRPVRPLPEATAPRFSSLARAGLRTR